MHRHVAGNVDRDFSDGWSLQFPRGVLMETVRAARPYDAGPVGVLCAEAVNELKLSTAGRAMLSGRPGILAKALSRPGGLARLIRDSKFAVAVGLFDEATVGFCVGSYSMGVGGVGSYGVGLQGTGSFGAKSRTGGLPMAPDAGGAPLPVAPVAAAAPHGPTEPTGIIEAVYVTPCARGVGVGGAMLDRVVALFEQRGCTGVDVSCLPGDRYSKRLMENAGFKARLIVMHRPRGASR